MVFNFARCAIHGLILQLPWTLPPCSVGDYSLTEGGVVHTGGGGRRALDGVLAEEEDGVGLGGAARVLGKGPVRLQLDTPVHDEHLALGRDAQLFVDALLQILHPTHTQAMYVCMYV